MVDFFLLDGHLCPSPSPSLSEDSVISYTESYSFDLLHGGKYSKSLQAIKVQNST